MPVGKRHLSQKPSAVYARERARALRAAGFCVCGQVIESTSLGGRCKPCRDRNVEIQRELRRKVLVAYGGKCACCGETEFKFLAVDHINGGGNKHRLLVAGNKKASILRWIVRNRFPKDFQILCHNCNVAKGSYGICPHKESRKAG